MASVLIWLIFLIILLLITNAVSGKVLLNPQFGFIAGFIPQAIYALFYIKKWGIDLSVNTLTVLIGGSVLFIFDSLVVSYLIRRSRRVRFTQSTDLTKKAVDNCKIEIDSWKMMTLIIFQICVLVFLLHYLQNLPGNTLAEKMYYRDHTSKRIEDGLEISGNDLSTILSVFRAFSYYSGFVTMYLMMHGIVYKYKTNRKLYFISYILSLLSSLFLGQRFGVYSLIISAFVEWYFIYGKATSWKSVITAKILRRALIIMLVLIFAFVWLGNFIGKGSDTSSSDYVAVYLAAQIKNLDTFVRNGNFGCHINNWQTLYSWINTIADVFHINVLKHFYDQPFYYYNGNSLGNVATIYYPFLHDCGYIGIILFTFIMVIIAQIHFQKAVLMKGKNTIDLSVIAYSYLFYGIIFSFYSNRFFSVVSPNYIKFLISIFALKFYFTKIKIRVGKYYNISRAHGEIIYRI